MRILVDMDDVIADWELGFLNAWFEQHPTIAPIPVEERRSFWLEEEYAPEHHGRISSIINAPGFFRHLPEVPGAVAALRALAHNHEVLICTTPLLENPTCCDDKLAWVREHLGDDWVRRVILTADKTLIAGELLIDDKPAVKGAHTPSWRHVLFDRPYNRSVLGDRMTWENHEHVLYRRR